MDNKGQTLVAFVFILPIILLILLAVIDYGQISLQKQEAISSVKDSITYALKNNDNNNEAIKQLLYKNIDKEKIQNLIIDITDEKVSIDLNLKPNHIFNFLNINNNIKLAYIGTKNNNDIIIEKR